MMRNPDDRFGVAVGRRSGFAMGVAAFMSGCERPTSRVLGQVDWRAASEIAACAGAGFEQ